MFNPTPDKSPGDCAPGHDQHRIDFDVSGQLHPVFQRFDVQRLSQQPPSQAVSSQSQPCFGQFQPSRQTFTSPSMDWASAGMEDATAQSGEMELDELNPAGVGVMNLIAHFENIKRPKPIARSTHPIPNMPATDQFGNVDPSRTANPAPHRFAQTMRNDIPIGPPPLVRFGMIGQGAEGEVMADSPMSSPSISAFSNMDDMSRGAGDIGDSLMSPFSDISATMRIASPAHSPMVQDIGSMENRMTSPMIEPSTSPFGNMDFSAGGSRSMQSPAHGGYRNSGGPTESDGMWANESMTPFGLLENTSRTMTPIPASPAHDFVNMGISRVTSPSASPFQTIGSTKVATMISKSNQGFRRVNSTPTSTPTQSDSVGASSLSIGGSNRPPIGLVSGSSSTPFQSESLRLVQAGTAMSSPTNIPQHQAVFRLSQAPQKRPSDASRARTNPPTSTPGFNIWKPPVPKTPKPTMIQHNPHTLQNSQNLNASQKTPSTTPYSPLIKIEDDIGMEQSLPPQSLTPTPAAPAVVSPSSPARAAIPTTFSIQNPAAMSLRSQQGRPSRELVPAEAWESYRPTIRRLYLEERRPLKEVMQMMADHYGFQATPKMYKTRFSQWGFVKNNTEEEVKRLLSMKFQRDAKGKVSEFVRNGRVINLGTYLKRKGVTEYDLVDFETPADLPSYVRCRTPTPPPAPGFLRSPDLLRAQETVVGNMRKAFLHCRQLEVEANTTVGWSSMMLWGAGSSDLLYEANKRFEMQETDQGGHLLIEAFKQLETDLKTLSPQGIKELLLGMAHRDPGMMTALSKYLAAYSSTNLERSHPLRQIFACLYEVQQKHGPVTLSDFVWGCTPTIAEELETIYGRRHPYVARTWVDLASFYGHANQDRLAKLVAEIHPLRRSVQASEGLHSAEDLALRYTIVQLMHSASPDSEQTRTATLDLWQAMRDSGRTYGLRGTAHTYCYHDPIKVNPWTKRCKERYATVVELIQRHAQIKIVPYFEEDMHDVEHAPSTQDAWAAAVEHMGPSRWTHI